MTESPGSSGSPGSPGSPETSGRTVIPVRGAAPYDVVVGTNLLGELPGMLGDGVQRVAVIHPRALATTGEAIRQDLAEQGYDAELVAFFVDLEAQE